MNGIDMSDTKSFFKKIWFCDISSGQIKVSKMKQITRKLDANNHYL